MYTHHPSDKRRRLCRTCKVLLHYAVRSVLVLDRVHVLLKLSFCLVLGVFESDCERMGRVNGLEDQRT